MPNLVGIGNSQVPTNAMLGGLAYQDSVGEIDLEKIKARISDTAVDIFVYDTRKDSDGGAWRHRTQNLSWYNEGASVLRGARKEFPAVAVLVLQSLKLTIYDGDDPNLPMWMVVTGANNNYAIETAAKCTAALNGIICIGCGGSGHDFYYVNFLQDAAYEMSTGAHNRFVDNIGTRSSHDRNPTISPAVIISRKINDVAMTVLPNAPIDPDTGLPIPTIAVGTDAGVSVINNDGTTEGTTVADITNTNSGYNYVTQIEIDEKYVYIGFGASNLYIAGIGYAVPIPSSDVSLGAITGSTTAADFRWSNNSTSGSGTYSDYYVNPSDSNSDDVNGTVLTKRGMSFGTESGLSILLNEERDTNGSIAHVTKDYNTGYMHGDIKCAFLSDTDTTNITSTNLMSGATYNTSSRVDSYSYSNGSSTLVINDQQSSADGYVNLTLGGLTASTHYVITVTANQSYTPTSGYNHHLGNTTDGTIYFEDNFVGTTTPQSLTFKTPSSGNPTIVLYSGYNGALTYTLDLRLAEFDRSPGSYSAYNSGQSATIGQKDGIGIHGTITKEPVATGAELVSYGPFSTSNRLRQPYNSNLRFETGDFHVMFWLYNTGTNDHETLVSKDEREFSIDILANTTYYRRFRIYAQNSSNTVQYFDSTNTPWPINAWNHICVNFTNGNTCTIYVNGVFNVTGTWSGTGDYDIDSTSYGLNIGARNTSGSYAHAADGTKLALVRIAGSAPSARQVKKIYDDEKCLFHEDAKCTLYGTSDDVNAIAYDDSNNILHVGTSAGRSEFQGLNRINNTTTAVTTAISASNELVAEQ